MFFISTAWAQEAAAQATGKGPSMIEQFVPFIAIFAIFYFFIIRPQSRRAKDHQTFITALKRGDNVLTSSGIFGKVEGITDQFVKLEISEGVEIRVLKTQISGPVKEGNANV
jgi:preprotein translocase subunit YajC